MSLLGLDVGISGCKGVAFNLAGDVLAQAYCEVPLYQPRPGWMELDPLEVWQAIAGVIRQVAQGTAGDPVQALSISTHGESVLPVDAQGRPLYRFITAIDTRAAEQARSWEAWLGREAVYHITGMPLHPMYTVNKLLWLRQYEPDIFHAAHRFLCMPDFFFQRLGLPPAMDYSLAARTMAFDVTRLAWSDEILRLARLDADRLSPVLPAGSIVGTVPAAAAAELGLGPGVIAAVGGHDQPSGALGCGAITAGVAMDSTGTVECVAVTTPRLTLAPELMVSNLPIAAHAVPGMYLVLGYSSTGGALLRWYRDTFASAERQQAGQTGEDVYDLILEQVAPGPSPVLILPHFVGSGTPWMDPRSRGAILGLDLRTTRGQIVQAILDSVTYETKLSVDAMEAAGIAVRELRACGGGARSARWLQTKADIFDKPVVAMEVSEAPCLGVALLAGVALGAFPGLAAAVAAMVRVKEVYQPDSARSEQYAARARTFAKIYPALAEHALDALLLQRVSSFAWATCGAASYVNTATGLGEAALLITPRGRYVLTNNIEATRLDREEELGRQGWQLNVVPWYQPGDALSSLTRGLRLGADGPVPGAADVSSAVAALRADLMLEEIQRFRELGRLCAAAMDGAVRAVRPGRTEHEIAARLAAEAERRGVQPIVNLIATDERIYAFRHPLPTSRTLERYAMLVLCGRRRGLVCSVTRLVHFGPLPADLRRRAEAVACIDATFIDATRPGQTLGAILLQATEAYFRAGFGDEWQLHHQGGPAGYEPREWLATPGSSAVVHAGQIYAWNPSITGCKSEDTILVDDGANEVLTAIDGWPEVSVAVGDRTYARPAILEVI